MGAIFRKRQLQAGDFALLAIVNMTTLRKTVTVLLLSALALAGLAGCAPEQRDSSIPWSRPADWEGRIPGMGG